MIPGLTTTWAVEALGASALLMALVLALRVPVRRVFGARVAYALWLLPVLRLALPSLPQQWRGGATMPVSDMGAQAITVLVDTTTSTTSHAAEAVATAAPLPWLAILSIAWAIGAAAFLVWQAADYVRFRRRVLRDAVTVARVGGIAVVESRGADGPLAFGIVQRFVAFPRDFADRYDAAERDLALAHELGHHARGDLVANWVALVTLALHWWNPVAWFAFRAFRADQEMANDAGVLARVGAEARHAYGCAIVKAAHGRAVGAACHLHSVEDIKGRLRMLKRREGSGARLLAGMGATAALTLSALFVTASGSAAAERVRATVATTTGVDLDALEAVTAFQSDEPAEFPAAVRPGETKRASRVVITRDGETRTYEGADADAYIAAHPMRTPPVPPMPVVAAVPPAPATPLVNGVVVPPVPPVPPHAIHLNVPTVVSRACVDGRDGAAEETVVHRDVDGRQRTIICRNRIAAMRQHAVQEAMRSRKQALGSALASLRLSRSEVAHNADMSEDSREAALDRIDDAIDRMRDEITDAD